MLTPKSFEKAAKDRRTPTTRSMRKSYLPFEK
jgi:hypothetical protein